ncbi:hypothetical protein COCVIDRAFT_32851 [Bipolaris victoriae FI3]|uniref:Smr domain-containing protein n=1 Tax=Bipolaris victoriae (strain FI3) TaxID=930091 RepID=W7EXI9_BIPV3|nr:hypothetical protein COCVIDRAFT_32851 [Bipolaris victoriae FI3]
MTARSRSPVFGDVTSINLNRLLSRLERIVLADPSPELRKSSYERARVSANIEHARTLLLNLEHSASTIPSKSKKSELQTDLQQKRELIKQLNQRIYELNQLDDTESDGSVDSDQEDADEFPSYAPRVKTEAGRDITTSGGNNEALQNAAQGLASELRRRGKPEADGAESGAQAASGNSLFPSKPTTTTGDPTHAQTEALLSYQRNEQETLTTSLLDMAKLLKQQSINFSNTLEGDKSVVDRALAGLDKNTLNMDAASRRMGTLRKMTEGKGWWDRMRLYGMIAGLWLIAFLIVFVGPKVPLNHSSADAEAEYDRLRDLARQEAAKRSSCFDRAHQAYESGDGAAAHELSQEGKKHAEKMEQYNRQARDFIFRENNAEGRVDSDTIDLHGLFVEEAEDVLEERIKVARQQGQTHLHVIVGKGNHSKNHVQKIKPRVEQVCRELGLQYRTEENEGRIFVNLQGGSVDEMPPPPHAPSAGYPGHQQHHGGAPPQHHGGQHQQQHDQQQNQNDEIEQMVKKGLPKLLKMLKCCTVM